ncbi:MAG: hypothetical protein LH603_20225 [Pseudonocardia sp.]|nr:hypothetical protein [Pseudonocardia sp.]
MRAPPASPTSPPPEFVEFYGSMINMDDPRHTRLRRIVSRGFTPRRLDGLLSDVTHTARSMVDDIIDAGECDAVRAISARLPLHLVDEIPVSAAGKVLKRELRDRLTKEVGAERQRQPSDPALTPDG